MKVLLASILLLGLTGCTTNPATIEHVGKMAVEMSKVKTFEGECTGPCKFAYTDPRDRVNVKLPTNGFDAAIAITDRVTGLISGAVVPAAMGMVAVEGFKALKGSGASSTSTVTTSSTVDSHNVTTTTDSTHTPTVVNQPAPVVVTQPAPVIVTQPDPIVVTP